MKHILLVDDHRTFLAGTAIILEKHGFRVTTAHNGAEALSRMNQTQFDLYIYDLKLPEMNGFDLTEATLRRHPEAAVVILTGEDIAEHYDRLIELGATGMLEKSLGEQEFIGSIHFAMQQLTVLPLYLAKQLRTRQSLSAGAGCENGSAGRQLTEKELAVLKLIAQGFKNKEIAERLYMSQRNIEYAISHLFEKLNVSSRQEAVMKGIELKWLNLNL